MAVHKLVFPDEANYLLFLKIAEAAGFEISEDGTVSKKPSTVLSAENRQHHLSVIAAGGSGTSILDPLAWQHEQRADRDLPSRS
ncbi:hypothetical protein IC235_07900 [Hymenobacter sp. BT664]|uniref:Uncharacterized protein n=1 Tax=Hymenobacter montanus TaxID=2771359 RepID=A0A927GJ58_9BACT|nr:hypothetical protein [Hymenobacter montanus]MBD2767814.1 hypothetical protein [Hymenobacter montanus]